MIMHPHVLEYPLLFLLLGVLLLFLGRSLFWLFIGVAGFVVGIELARVAFPNQPELFVLVLALGLGLLGAIFAIFLQKVAIGIAGFFTGGYLAAMLFASLAGNAGPYSGAEWLAFLVGGLIGAAFMVVFFDWALIILSSFQGAHLIVRAATLRPGHHAPILFLILAAVGIAVQASTYRRVKPAAAL